MAKLYQVFSSVIPGQKLGDKELLIRVNEIDILQETQFGCVVRGDGGVYLIDNSWIGKSYFRTEQEARDSSVKYSQQQIERHRLDAKCYIKAIELCRAGNLPPETKVPIK